MAKPLDGKRLHGATTTPHGLRPTPSDFTTS
jgi:hypothetical protein